MAESAELTQALTPGAQHLVQAAMRKQREGAHTQLSLHHWLLALVERHGPMAEAMAKGLEAASLRRYLYDQLRQGYLGAPLDLETVIRQAHKWAQDRGKAQVAERDLAAAILIAAGYTLVEIPTPPQAGSASATPLTAPAYQPRAKHPTPTLEAFGRDLTREAQQGKLWPIVGREDEIQLIIETLCRRTKRNPALIGPAGVGKTAIVEGLAQRVVRGEVPEMLQGVRILAIQPSTLVIDTHLMGELQKRMEAILNEASQDGIILFIDEMHSMVGAGGMVGRSDVASLLKPALARGDLACIAATTDDEYRRFIEPDAALERRFQPIRVQELTAEQTLIVLSALRDEFARLRGVQASDEVLSWLVDFAGQSLRNRFFPDKAVDLLEQCIAYATTQGKHTVELVDAKSVAQRIVGMPLAPSDRLNRLREQLSESALLTEEDMYALLDRLEVTMRGLDLRPARPNAVVLLIGNATAGSEMLAEMIAETLFGSAGRVIVIDFSRFVHPADVTMLVGAPPGYVGYNDVLPLHRVIQTPWCVLRCENIHACHPQVLEVLRQALADGFLTDAQGKRIYLSDTVVLLTAKIALTSSPLLGFRLPEDSSTAPNAHWAAEKALGAEFVAQVDLICAEAPALEVAQRDWLEQHFLTELSERYRKQGVHLFWDRSLVDWLMSQRSAHANQRDWERLVDERITPLLIPYLPAADQKEVRSLLVKYKGGRIHIEVRQPEEGGK